MLRLFLIIVVLSTQVLASGGKSIEMLSVQDAIKIAFEKNPEFNRLSQEINSKKGEWWQSFGIYDPELFYFKEGIGDTQPFSERRWGVTQNIDFPLTSYYRLRKVNFETQALESKYSAGRYNIIAEIKTQYTNLMYALEMTHLAKKQLDISENLVSISEARYEAGESSHLDLLKAEIQKAEADNAMQRAKQNFNVARYNLFKLIGLEPEQQRYSIQFSDTLTYIEVDIGQQSALHKLEIQPQYISMNKKFNAADMSVKQSWSEFLPNFSLSYYQQDYNYGDGYNYYGYQIGVNIPLWFFMNQRGKIQQKKAERNAVRWQRKETELEIKRQIEIAWHSYDMSKKNIQRFQQTIRSKARQLWDLTSEGYRTGDITLLALLEAQRTYLNSERQYFEALKDYYMTIIVLEKFMQIELLFTDFR